MELAFLLAILYGCIDVVSRMVNYQATRYLGTANGSFLNYFFGSLVCLAVLLVTGGGRQALAGALVAPWWSYLGAVCGLVAFLLLMVGLHRVKVFQSSVLLLVGQLAASLVLDRMMSRAFTARELLGMALVAAGIILDKKLTSRRGAEGQESAGQ